MLRLLGKERERHEVPLAREDLEDSKRGDTFGVIYDRYLFDVLAYPPVIRLLALLVLTEVLFILAKPEEFSRSMLALAAQGRCRNFSKLLRGLREQLAVIVAVGQGTSNHALLDRSPDRRSKAKVALVGGDLGLPLASFTVSGLYEGNDELFSPGKRGANGMGFAFVSNLLFVLTPLPLPLSVHEIQIF